jgi:hypothetical protein
MAAGRGSPDEDARGGARHRRRARRAAGGRAVSPAGRAADQGGPAGGDGERHLPAWERTPAWLHGGLLRPNLLVDGGRLCAVIDFGSAGIGDPAADVIAAWSVVGRSGRAAFRGALGVADGTWNRARGYALHQAALIIPYYGPTQSLSRWPGAPSRRSSPTPTTDARGRDDPAAQRRAAGGETGPAPIGATRRARRPGCRRASRNRWPDRSGIEKRGSRSRN